MSITPYQVYVFPLPKVVFFPHTSVALQVSEPRYLKMVKDSLLNKVPIALVPEFILNDSPFPPVCSMGMPSILQKKSDGSAVIMLHYVEKISLVSQLRQDPYLVYNCFPVLENEQLELENRFRFNRIRQELLAFTAKSYNPKAREQFWEKVKNHGQIINHACLHLLKDPKQQQELLEQENINQRLNLLLTFLDDSNLQVTL
ncbi:MAG: LON peptidase substrate-binding domain-containing protein [Bacteriovoracaceae bacterium]|nr:LON peptidase substrate-binding domain-containing protein [Bacteriovoracaceae bacterium]